MKTYKQFKNLLEELIKQSGAKGSNPGGVYMDSDDNSQYYIKHPYNPDQAKTEVLSANLYNLLGIKTLNPKLSNVVPNKLSVSSKFNDNLETLTSQHIPKLNTEHLKQLGSIYAAGVLTKNWDVIGSGIEYGQGNIAVDKKSGHLVSMDQGGSFNFRANGGHKDYDGDIPEKDSLRNSAVSEGAHFFNHVFKNSNVKPHVFQTLQNLDMKKVHHLFKDSGLYNWQDLHHSFVERHQKLLNHFSD